MYAAYRNPVVLIERNGERNLDLQERRVSFRYNERKKRRNDAVLIFADADRKYVNLLQPGDMFKIAWGYPGNMTSPRMFRLSEIKPDFSVKFPLVQITLIDSGIVSLTQVVTEPHKTHRPKNWGRIPTSAIAKSIARRHKLKFVGDDSEDVDNVDFVQPANVSDYAFLNRLADIIDFEFFIENGSLYYRKKPYDKRPRRTLIYYPQGGADTLLISFSPTQKIVKSGTKPNSVNVAESESVWLQRARYEVGIAAANATGVPISEALLAVDKLVTTDIPDSSEDANFLRKILGQNRASVTAHKQFEAGRDVLNSYVAQYRQALVDQKQTKKAAGKQTWQQRARPSGSLDASPQTPVSKSGDVPVGTSNSYLQIFDLLNGVKTSIVDWGVTQNTVQTSAGTDTKRKKVAEATQQKINDRGVTASIYCIGDPSLRNRVNYMVIGVERMYEGSWYSDEATHDITADYRVTLHVKRGAIRKGLTKGGKPTGKNAQNSTEAETAYVGVLSSGQWKIRTTVPASFEEHTLSSKGSFFVNEATGIQEQNASWPDVPSR